VSIVAMMAVINAGASLSQAEAFVLVVLASYADEHGGKCWPSQPTIAQKTRASRRGVQKVLRRLERRGLVSVVERASQHKTTRYRLNLPALTREEPRSPLDIARGEPGSPLKASRRIPRGEPQNTPEANHRTARGEPGSPDPSGSVRDPSQDQDQRADARRAYTVLEKLAHGVLEDRDRGQIVDLPSELAEALKSRAAHARIPYNSGSVTKALESAEVQRTVRHG
jgi:hypothetical protein